MAFDPKKLLEQHLSSFEAALKAAYEEGVQDGIERIVAAAKAPLPQNDGRTHEANVAFKATSEMRASGTVIRRAPRGLVPKIVGQMLSDGPGKIIAEYEQMKDDYDSRISEKSIGNELRRHEGTKYRKDDTGGWWPIAQSKEAEDAASNEQSSASDHSNQGERNGTALI